jgi:hypothetical protein
MNYQKKSAGFLEINEYFEICLIEKNLDQISFSITTEIFQEINRLFIKQDLEAPI